MDLMNGGATNESTAAIDRAIQESHAENYSAPVRTRNRPKSMRGGGRPRRGGAPNAATIRKMQLAMAQNPSSSVDPGVATTTADLGASAGSSDPHLSNTEELPVEFPPEAIAAAVKFPYDLAANATGFEGFRLDDRTALSVAPQIDLCLKKYCPQLKSEHAPLIMVCVTLGFTTATKYAAYVAWKREQEKVVEERKDAS